LARTLRGQAQAAFSVELAAKANDLSLEVEGFGQVRFPVTAAKARKLIGLGRPARFGRGKETLTDPDVRDTWEIPKHLVRALWDDGAGQERPQWVADHLPGLCAGLQATGSAGAVAARRLLDLAWEWLGKQIGTGFALSSPSYRDKELGSLGKPLASVLAAAAAIGTAATRDAVCTYIREQADEVTALEMSALRAATELPRDGARRDAGFGDLAADCAARLCARLARPQRAFGNWSIELPAGGCTRDLCGTLRLFLDDKSRRNSLARPRLSLVPGAVQAVPSRSGRPTGLRLAMRRLSRRRSPHSRS
jgi:hypothetical protein